MSFAEVYHIVRQASVSAHPAEIMSQLSSIPMDDLQEQEIPDFANQVTQGNFYFRMRPNRSLAA